MTPADLDALIESTTDPAAATLARALREAWAERDGADRARRDADSRASQLALAVNARDRVLDLAATVLGWPPAPTPAEAIDAALATVAKIARLENDLRQLRESYPRAEVLRMLDAARVPAGGIVQRVAWLIAEVATLTQQRDEARAERRAARLDRDAAEERVAELTAALREYAPTCGASPCASLATWVARDRDPWGYDPPSRRCDAHQGHIARRDQAPCADVLRTLNGDTAPHGGR